MDDLYKIILVHNIDAKTAKLKFKERNSLEHKEYVDEERLNEYIALCNYKKVIEIIQLLDKGNCISIDKNKVTNADFKLIDSIINLRNILPKRYHKCIGCIVVDKKLKALFKECNTLECEEALRFYLNQEK